MHTSKRAISCISNLCSFVHFRFATAGYKTRHFQQNKRKPHRCKTCSRRYKMVCGLFIAGDKNLNQ